MVLMEGLKLAGISLALAYIGLLLATPLLVPRLLFPKPPPSYAESAVAHWVEGPEGRIPLRHLRTTGTARGLVLYHYGNGEDMGLLDHHYQAFLERGFDVCVWDYPGYGHSDGSPSVGGIERAADAVWAYVTGTLGYTPEGIVLYGRSLGGGPATYLASRNPCAGLLLESTFMSVTRVITQVRLLPFEYFDTYARIRAIECPLLIVHGTADLTIPVRHGRALFERAREPKRAQWIEGGAHNDLTVHFAAAYWPKVDAWLTSLTLPAQNSTP